MGPSTKFKEEEILVSQKSLDFGDFVIEPVSGDIPHHKAAMALAAGQDPLGPLAKLRGTWKGTGFNQIWRPFDGLQQQPPQDRFLELNETSEILQFVEIQGDIPNRGLLQVDINLHGLTYLQRINDINVLTNGQPTGIHIEPGIWITIPPTTNPQDPQTVARLANIPHGTSLVSQGSAKAGAIPLSFPATDIFPFPIGNQNSPIKTFPEQDLSKPSNFRTPAADIPNVTQQIVNNPNLVLQAGLAGKTINSVYAIDDFYGRPESSGIRGRNLEHSVPCRRGWWAECAGGADGRYLLDLGLCGCSGESRDDAAVFPTRAAEL
jgi:hypothetical protein